MFVLKCYQPMSSSYVFKNLLKSINSTDYNVYLRLLTPTNPINVIYKWTRNSSLE